MIFPFVQRFRSRPCVPPSTLSISPAASRCIGISLLVVLLFSGEAVTQSPTRDQIENSGLYHYADGYGETKSKAEEDARHRLAAAFQATYVGKKTVQTTATIYAGVETFKDSVALSSSLMTSLSLRGVEFLQLPDIDHTLHVLAYIHKDSLEAAFDLQERRVNNMISLAEQEEEEGYLTDSLLSYYTAYLLSTTIARELAIEIHGIVYPTSERLLSQMQKLLDRISEETIDSHDVGGCVQATLSFTYRNNPVKSFDFIYNSDITDEVGEVKDGEGEIKLYRCSRDLKGREVILRPRLKFGTLSREVFELHRLIGERRVHDLGTEVTVRMPWADSLELAEISDDHSTDNEFEQVPGADSDRETVAERDNQEKVEQVQHVPEIVSTLLASRSEEDFTNSVQVYLNDGRLLVGHSIDELLEKGCRIYLVVLSSDTVSDIYQYEQGRYRSIKSGTVTGADGLRELSGKQYLVGVIQ